MVGWFPLKPVLVRLRGFRVVVFFHNWVSVINIEKLSQANLWLDWLDEFSARFWCKDKKRYKVWQQSGHYCFKTRHMLQNPLWLHRKKKSFQDISDKTCQVKQNGIKSLICTLVLSNTESFSGHLWSRCKTRALSKIPEDFQFLFRLLLWLFMYWL